MIILEKHFNKKDTTIYGDVVSNGCQTFHIEDLDKVCKRYNVSADIKQSVLDAFESNKGVDDPSQNILNKLKEINNQALNNAVALATTNMDLLKNAVGVFHLGAIMIIAEREDVDDDVIGHLLKECSQMVRFIIAGRKNLNDEFIEKLAKDEESCARRVNTR